MKPGREKKKKKKKKCPSESQTQSQTSIFVLKWQAKYANTAPDNLH